MKKRHWKSWITGGAALLLGLTVSDSTEAALERLEYNHPGLVVDLGVGLWAWPMPMDYDEDGDLDLLVACPDKPHNGVYFFENPGTASRKKMPVFRKGIRLGKASQNMQVSHVNGQPRVLRPGYEYVEFQKNGFKESKKIHSNTNPHGKRVRANMWRYVDYDGDGDQDLIVGSGDWNDYVWDHAYDSNGRWRNGPLRGFVYWLENTGTDVKPSFTGKERIRAGGADLEVYGWPSPNFADFDRDGDLDLICGEFLDGFTYFENTGSRKQPSYATGRRLHSLEGQPLTMDLQMITPTAIDWDSDGDQDLIVGDEDGRVALVENTGKFLAGAPLFKEPAYFQQEANTLKFGALATPFVHDWDGDGDQDILCGNTAGHIAWFENLGGGATPKWNAPERLKTGDQVLRIQAGPTGSIQGPCEAKWGYTTISVADWDHDGLADILANSIWGKVVWYRNIGKPGNPRLAAEQPIRITGNHSKPDWFWWDATPGELVTQWRTTPMAVDFNQDDLTDLVMLDSEGYLSLFKRSRNQDGSLALGAPRRIFVDEDNQPVRLNSRSSGRSGRYKISVVDWDGDGRLDVLVNSENASWYRNSETRGDKVVLKKLGNLGKRNVAGHTSSPTVADFDADGLPDLVVGAEDGRIYHLAHADAVQFKSEQKKARAPRKPSQKGLLAQPGVVKDEFIFTSAPHAECHASTICETERGLVAAWFGGTKEGRKDVGIWTTYNDGSGWSRMVQAADGVQYQTDDGSHRHPCWNPVLFQPPGDAPTQLFFKVGPNPREWWGELLVSYDRGRSWRDRRRLPEGIDGPVKNKPVLMPDGSILAGSSTEYDGWRVHFERTSDQGATWSRVGPINDGKEFNAIQPSILQHADGRLQILCRSRENRVTTSWSTDQGKTWSKMEATNLPNPNAGTDAMTLADGRHLLVYNHTVRNAGEWRGRSMLNVAVSENGKDWKAALVLEQEPRSEFSYPAVIQTQDGLVHITYTWKRKRIKRVVVDPARLELVPIKAGAWPAAKKYVVGK